MILSWSCVMLYTLPCMQSCSKKKKKKGNEHIKEVERLKSKPPLMDHGLIRFPLTFFKHDWNKHTYSLLIQQTKEKKQIQIKARKLGMHSSPCKASERDPRAATRPSGKPATRRCGTVQMTRVPSWTSTTSLHLLAKARYRPHRRLLPPRPL